MKSKDQATLQNESCRCIYVLMHMQKNQIQTCEIRLNLHRQKNAEMI